MSKPMMAVLETTCSEVLAELAFMFGGERGSPGTPDERWLETTIRYAGPERGELRFRCPRGFAVSLAANLLGLDPVDDEAEAGAEDAVKEFMNVLCGHWVTAVYGAHVVFNLSIPEVRELSEPPAASRGQHERIVSLSIEGHPLQLEYLPEQMSLAEGSRPVAAE